MEDQGAKPSEALFELSESLTLAKNQLSFVNHCIFFLIIIINISLSSFIRAAFLALNNFFYVK